MAAKRKNLTKKIRFEVFKRDSFTCQYCGQSAPDVVLEVDHIKPIATGGDNELLNLVTSCKDCNRGKGKRELSNKDELKKQVDQLKELNKKREQLRLMMEWKNELSKLEDQKIEYINDFLEDYDTKLSDYGVKLFKKNIKKYGYQMIYDCLETSFEQYYISGNKESVTKALDYVERIAKCKAGGSDNPMIQKIFYIRGILRNRLTYINERKLMTMLNKYILNDADYETVLVMAKDCNHWTGFCDWFEEEFY